jgi:MoxR-like ATPase
MINSQLDSSSVPNVVGIEPRKLLDKGYKIISNTNWPLYLTGPSGSGKSIIAMNMAKRYADENNVPAYYVQLSPEQTKTSLILGLRLVDGSLKAVNGVVAECMEKGGIVIIDEAAHATQEMLLMFNSILDRTSITSIGDKTVISKDTFRILFCANDSTYSGNVKLPQSFAQRLVGFYCDYPSWQDEVEIVKQVTGDECAVAIKVPDEVIQYIVSLMREIRKEKFPLSVRNASIATVLLELALKKEENEVTEDDKYFTQGSNVESVRRNIANRIFNQAVNSAEQLNGPEIKRFTRYVTRVGIEEFKNIILQSFMYYLDLDCGFYDLDQTKDQLKQKIL